MTLEFEKVETSVPIDGEQAVSISPEQPWPSAYRGSQYSLVSNDDFDAGAVLKWEQRDLKIYAEQPSGLWRTMTIVGKEGGLGSFRVTAGGEVLTKVKAEEYSHVDEAPASDGWVPVYLGRLSGEIDFDSVSTNPHPPTDGVKVWTGLPFNHGERWAVSHDDKLIWKWRDYRFESALDHSDIVNKYAEYRPNPGRLYITEHGHVWINVPMDGLPPGRKREIQQAVSDWRQRAESSGNTSSLRLVNRRMTATSGSEDPAEGHIPIHIGHVEQFDDATIPRPVVDDEAYYLEVGQYEEVWE
jgi:hypothetical protein